MTSWCLIQRREPRKRFSAIGSGLERRANAALLLDCVLAPAKE